MSNLPNEQPFMRIDFSTINEQIAGAPASTQTDVIMAVVAQSSELGNITASNVMMMYPTAVAMTN